MERGGDGSSRYLRKLLSRSCPQIVSALGGNNLAFSLTGQSAFRTWRCAGQRSCGQHSASCC